MKNVLSALPLLLAAAAIALTTAALAFGLRIITPDTLAAGIGLLTCSGLCAMGTADRSGRRYC